MNTLTMTRPATASTANTARDWGLGSLLIADALLSFAPLVVLGVSMFMALALALLCIGGWRRGGMPAWLAAPGVVSAALLGAMLLPALRVPLHVPVAAAVTVLTLWMLAAGAWCLRRR